MHNEDIVYPLRRIITGLNAKGSSVVHIDGPPAAVHEFSVGAGLYEIWTDTGGELSRHDERDHGEGAVSLCPSQGGTKIRWFTVTPSQENVSPEELEVAARDAFGSVNAAGHRPDTTRHAGMHLTPTIDFIILVKGQVRLVLDEGERLLSPGDVVVQRGTNHAWVCEGDEPAILVAVLIDKQFAD